MKRVLRFVSLIILVGMFSFSFYALDLSACWSLETDLSAAEIGYQNAKKAFDDQNYKVWKMKLRISVSTDSKELAKLVRELPTETEKLSDLDKAARKAHKDLLDIEKKLEECIENQPEIKGKCGHTYPKYQASLHDPKSYNC